MGAHSKQKSPTNIPCRAHMFPNSDMRTNATIMVIEAAACKVMSDLGYKKHTGYLPVSNYTPSTIFS